MTFSINIFFLNIYKKTCMYIYIYICRPTTTLKKKKCMFFLNMQTHNNSHVYANKNINHNQTTKKLSSNYFNKKLNVMKSYLEPLERMSKQG